MSYSYVKTVFPNFEFSNVYNDKLYTNINSVTTPLQDVQDLDSARIDIYKQGIPNFKQDIPNNYFKQDIPNFKQGIPNFKQDIPNFKQDIPNINLQENLENINLQENTPKDNKKDYHDDYINHINGCPSCKEALLKQLGVETERLKNDEIMELISYLIFGIFILILLDSLKK